MKRRSCVNSFSKYVGFLYKYCSLQSPNCVCWELRTSVTWKQVSALMLAAAEQKILSFAFFRRHLEFEKVPERLKKTGKQKQAICELHGFTLCAVYNSSSYTNFRVESNAAGNYKSLSLVFEQGHKATKIFSCGSFHYILSQFFFI